MNTSHNSLALYGKKKVNSDRYYPFVWEKKSKSFMEPNEGRICIFFIT